MTTATMTVPDISCAGCATSITNALKRLPGVSEVNVDVATKQVNVLHDERINQAQLVDRLKLAGFQPG